MNAETPPGAIGATPTDALPPVPLTDDQLEPLDRKDAVEAVHVPDSRPEAVHTLAGRHRGDIMDFYVETADQFVKYGYTMAADGRGLAWHKYLPTSKDERAYEAVRMDLEDYRRLEVEQ